MFSARYWRHLFRSELHGFPGFVFGILMLAAIPLYVATTTLIIRTKKPLFTIPVPTHIQKIINQIQPTLIEKEQEDKQETPTQEDKSNKKTDNLPQDLPTELRAQYLRVRAHDEPPQYSALNQPSIPSVSEAINQIPTHKPIIDEIPLPTNFDIEPSVETFDDLSEMNAPSFSDISFDDDTISGNETYNPVAEFLASRNTEFTIKDNIIITPTHAIATHTDDDFWVADTEFWFATGKQILSPIKQLAEICESQNLKPVLFLGATNIMNLDKLKTEWKTLGITIATEFSELPE